MSTSQTTESNTIDNEITVEAPESFSRTGIIAGVSVAITVVCLIAVGAVLFVRRLKRNSDNKSQYTDNTIHMKGTKQQPEPNELQNNNVFDLAHEEIPEPSNITFKLEHEDNSGQQYAVVLQLKSQKKACNEIECSEEDEYNRLEHLIKVETDTTDGNVYDSMMGMKSVDDPTYDSAFH